MTALAALLAMLALASGPRSAVAATPGLTITSSASYVVLPEQGRVAVTAHLTITNHLKNTVAKTYFFRTGYLTVQPGTSGFRLAASGVRPAVSVRDATDTFTSLKLDFGRNLAAGKSMALTLTFDIRDAGGEPDRPVRISPSLVTFAAWAFATPDTPGSSVAVQMPGGYRVSIGRGPLDGPTADEAGQEHWTSGTLAAPLDFVADIVADRQGAYTETPVSVPLANGSASVLVHAWPDDAAWGDRVANLAAHALPILEREIGVGWPVDGALSVNEVLVRGTGGYAGVFDPAERRVDISYAASDEVVIHELAHAWFNGRLVADRWAAEGFAAYYADIATRELGLDIRPRDPVAPGPDAIPLNAWGNADSADAATELYAYAASHELADEIAGRAGGDALLAVWARAARGIGAYQADPSGAETVTGAPDWRGLLDLLEDQTGQPFDDLWRKWVARPDDLTTLDARAAARAAYADTVKAAGDWRLPTSIRDAMRTWRFDVARAQLDAANAVLDQRTTLEAAAKAADVQLPTSLRDAFQGSDGLDAAAAEAASEQSAVEMIASASTARPAGAGVLDGILAAAGLAGHDPFVDLGAAKLALQSGNASGAYDRAKAARDTWAGAVSTGRGRIVSLVLLAAALAIVVILLRGRRGSAASPTPPASTT